jgi:hypothetical protein
LAALGCAFVVSAVESLSDSVLRHLAKGHTRADVLQALAILETAGIPLRPTFVAFTPWTSRRDYLDLLDFVAEHDLLEHVDPVQYTIRLLVPPRSSLLADASAASWLGPLDQPDFSYTWEHPDPAMDALQRALVAMVEHAIAIQRSNAAIFAEVRAAAEAALDMRCRQPVRLAPRSRSRTIPHLTESWFC